MMRKILFWTHLIAGVGAGIVILIMSVTGVLLTFERQITNRADRSSFTITPGRQAPLSVGALLDDLRAKEPAAPGSLAFESDPAAPVTASYGRERTLFLDPYNGKILGEGSKGTHEFFEVMEQWHRWLGADGANRATARAVTGACNLAMWFLVLSGPFLWLPRRWSWPAVQNALLFRGKLTGRARYWNWHCVTGIWCAVPLFFVVMTGVIMSYPWANNLLYQLTGTQAPQQGGRGEARGGPRNGAGPAQIETEGLDAALARAKQQVPGWRTITMRLPASRRAPVAFQIDTGTGGQPDRRGQLTLDRRTTEVVSWEPFSSQNTGRRLRSWARFVHTGEAGGVAGQVVALVATAGGAFLVYTGFVLAWRRFAAGVRGRGPGIRAPASRVVDQEPAYSGRGKDTTG